MGDARGTRRRSLTELKTDRLAFITGQNRTLAQYAPQDAAFVEDMTTRETPGHDHSEDIIADNVPVGSNKQKLALNHGTDSHKVESNNPLAANYALKEQKDEAMSHGHHNPEGGEDISGQLFTTSILEKPASLDEHKVAKAQAPNMFFAIFKSSDIGHSVLETQNIRLLFAFVMAILVISSYNGSMIGGRLLSGIKSLRPLFLLLLTDVAIILGRVWLKFEKDANKAQQEGEGWPNHLGKIMEFGQALHLLLSAAFMDCSICAVIMLCSITV